MSAPTAPIVAAGLVGGYLTARHTRREYGGVVLGAAGLWSGRRWLRNSGPARAGALGAIYLGAFGASHPLAKRIGAWPSVLTVSALASGAAFALADRRRR